MSEQAVIESPQDELAAAEFNAQQAQAQEQQHQAEQAAQVAAANGHFAVFDQDAVENQAGEPQPAVAAWRKRAVKRADAKSLDFLQDYLGAAEARSAENAEDFSPDYQETMPANDLAELKTKGLMKELAKARAEDDPTRELDVLDAASKRFVLVETDVADPDKRILADKLAKAYKKGDTARVNFLTEVAQYKVDRQMELKAQYAPNLSAEELDDVRDTVLLGFGRTVAEYMEDYGLDASALRAQTEAAAKAGKADKAGEARIKDQERQLDEALKAYEGDLEGVYAAIDEGDITKANFLLGEFYKLHPQFKDKKGALGPGLEARVNNAWKEARRKDAEGKGDDTEEMPAVKKAGFLRRAGGTALVAAKAQVGRNKNADGAEKKPGIIERLRRHKIRTAVGAAALVGVGIYLAKYGMDNPINGVGTHTHGVVATGGNHAPKSAYPNWVENAVETKKNVRAKGIYDQLTVAEKTNPAIDQSFKHGVIDHPHTFDNMIWSNVWRADHPHASEATFRNAFNFHDALSETIRNHAADLANKKV